MRFPGAIEGASGHEARVQFVRGLISAIPDGKISAVRAFGSGAWGDRLEMLSQLGLA